MGQRHRCVDKHTHIYIWLSAPPPPPPHTHTYVWLSAKRCTNGGSDFWLSIKSISNILSCCCFVCASITGQYHSGNNMSSKSGAAGEIFFESEKRHGIWPLKTDTLTVSAFWWTVSIHVHDEIKTLPQSLFCTEEILLYTVHIKSIITKFCFGSFHSKCPLIERYVCWNVSWPASTDNLVKNWLSLSSKPYSSHCGTSLHRAPMFYFSAKCLGSFLNIFCHSS